MNDRQTIISLTEEDRRLLKKRYFLVWTGYKWFLIGTAGVFGGLWLWIGWLALYHHDVGQIFFIFTCMLVVMLASGWWVTSVYQTKTAAPLEQDIREDRKIQKIGHIIRIKWFNKYSQKLIFQTLGQTDTEEFVLNSRIYHVDGDMLILGREVELEYTPHARFLLSLRLLVPLTSEEVKQRQLEEQMNITDRMPMFILLGIFLLEMGWLFYSLT
jgi:hypothetical protein